MVAGYWITERQWLSFVGGRHGWSPHDVRARTNFAALAVAMTAPDAVAPRRDVPELASRLAAQLTALLTRPPIAVRPRGLAFGTIDLECSLNGYRLALGGRERTRLAAAIERSRLTADRVERRLAASLVELPEPDAAQAHERALADIGPPALARPMIVISMPWTRVGATADPEEAEYARLRQQRLVPHLRRTTRRLAGYLFEGYLPPAALPDDESGSAGGTVHIEIPVIEVGWSRDPGHVTFSVSRCLWEACAHATLGFHGASYGAGLETGRLGPETVTLYLDVDDGWPPSALVVGNLPATRATLETVCNDDRAIIDAYEGWLLDNAREIRAAWRAADLRLIRYGGLAAKFTSHLEAMSHAARGALARMAGIDVDGVAMLMNPHGLERLGRDAVERAACVLQIDALHYLDPAKPGPLSPGQLDALFEFAHAAPLPPQSSRRLLREAERQQAAGVLRFGLLELREWAAFRDELGERLGGKV